MAARPVGEQSGDGRGRGRDQAGHREPDADRRAEGPAAVERRSEDRNAHVGGAEAETDQDDGGVRDQRGLGEREAGAAGAFEEKDDGEQALRRHEVAGGPAQAAEQAGQDPDAEDRADHGRREAQRLEMLPAEDADDAPGHPVGDRQGDQDVELVGADGERRRPFAAAGRAGGPVLFFDALRRAAVR